ncbi:MAG: tetratricopeptide repeat protein [Candidatus Omnitrophica bacterium]|nr:tetratricopeptide repeat protein [Candidatus Omnitrophota bacterium]
MLKRATIQILVYVFIAVLISGFLETTSGLNQKGNKLYEEKRYTSALESYRKAQIKNPDDAAIRYNLGTTLYQMDQFQEAEAQLKHALDNAKTKDLQATAWYNYGNTQYRLGQFDAAAEAYRKALDLNPNDKDAKYNLEILQKKKKIFDLKQDKRDDEQKNNPPPPEQQKQQQKQEGGGSQQKQDQSQDQSKDQQQKQDQGQDEQDDQQKEQDQKEKARQDREKEEQKQDQQQSDEKEAESKKGEGEEAKSQPITPLEEEQNQDGPKQEGEPLKPLLQGQMSKENALRILNALKESEQDLQTLRQPRRQSEHEPLKDW